MCLGSFKKHLQVCLAPRDKKLSISGGFASVTIVCLAILLCSFATEARCPAPQGLTALHGVKASQTGS